MRLPLVTLAALVAAVLSACGASVRRTSLSSSPVARDYGGYPAREKREGVELAVATLDHEEGGGGGGVPAAPPPASMTNESEARDKIVVEGWVAVAVPDVSASMAAIRIRVGELSGRVMDESMTGGGDDGGGYATMRVRVPPAAAAGFVAWLDQLGDVEARRLTATDVTREFFERELALENYRLAMGRLQKLLEAGGGDVKAVLEIEREMTRIRGEIERIEGMQRFVQDRVDLATIDVTLRPGKDAVFAPHAKLHPGPRFSVLRLLDADGREATRLGGGVLLHFHRHLTVDLDVFPEVEREGAAVVATVGGGLYSDYLGRGRRRFFNPWIGLRLGYAHLDGSAFVVAGEVGLEIFKHEYLLVEASVRAAALVGDTTEPVLGGGLSVAVPF